jgi:hypothetical protein
MTSLEFVSLLLLRLDEIKIGMTIAVVIAAIMSLFFWITAGCIFFTGTITAPEKPKNVMNAKEKKNALWIFCPLASVFSLWFGILYVGLMVVPTEEDVFKVWYLPQPTSLAKRLDPQAIDGQKVTGTEKKLSAVGELAVIAAKKSSEVWGLYAIKDNATGIIQYACEKNKPSDMVQDNGLSVLFFNNLRGKYEYAKSSSTQGLGIRKLDEPCFHSQDGTIETTATLNENLIARYLDYLKPAEKVNLP